MIIMKRLTIEEFIEKAKKCHKDEYDYSKVEYVNAQTKVCIICHEKDIFGNEHGEFWVKPGNFLQGSRCPKCNCNHWTTESFISAAKLIHGDKYDYSKVEYVNSQTKVCIICHEKDKKGNEIGEFWQLPIEHLKGHGCSREQRGIKEDRWEERLCPICGKKIKVRKKYEKICCSEECRLKYIKLHKDEINQKRIRKLKNTISKQSKEEREKIKARRIEKIKKTCLERYGTEYYAQREETRKMLSDKMKKQKHAWDEKNLYEKIIPKYKKICEEDNLELLEFRNRFDCTVKCKKCGDIFITRTLGYLAPEHTTNRCKICHPYEMKWGTTKMEDEMAAFLDSLNVKYYRNWRQIIYPLEIDFFLPEYEIGIEMNGLYWHSEVQKPDPQYHLNKTKKCLEQGVKLIHIFEDEWMTKQDICKSIIRNAIQENLAKIGARLCDIRKIDTEVGRDFLMKNHIQGFIPFKVGYGLYYNDELVEVMTFGGLRKNMGYKQKNGEWEILRMCSKMGTTVVGGASRILKKFIKENNPKRIITYADRRWGEGDSYAKIGFTFIRETKPNYSYVIGFERKNRYAFRKSELIRKYGCPTEKTEHEFCLENKWYRIYDSGSNLYEMILEN